MPFPLHALVLANALVLLLRAPAAAQETPAPERFAVEPYVHLAVPRGAVADRWGVGVGVGVQASVRLDPRHALYAGYGATRFGLDPIADTHALDRGFAAGVMRSFPGSGGGALVPWVRAGVLAHRLSVVSNAGEETGPADGGAGLEVGAGIGLQRRRGVRSTVALEYRGYSARVLEAEREGVSYAALRVGVSFAF